MQETYADGCRDVVIGAAAAFSVPFVKCMDAPQEKLRVKGALCRQLFPGQRGESGAAEDEVPGHVTLARGSVLCR